MGEEVKDIVERLRAKASRGPGDCAIRIEHEAAAEIESLRASLTRVEEERDEAREQAISHCVAWVRGWGVDSSAEKLCKTIARELRDAFSTRPDDLSRATSAEGK